MQITVFGATGRTGVPLVEQALARGHEVVAFVWSPEKLTVEDDALIVIEGADAVVSVLGQTDDGPDDLLAVAGEYITAAMAEAGVSRFVTLVGAGVREEGETISLSGKVMGTLLKIMARSVLADAETHVEQVRGTNLDWTVVRAPRLTTDEGTGDYRAGDIDLGFESVARADVARFILDCIEGEEYVCEMPKVGAV
jgi:putative NADH-flavin reductase